MVCLSCCFVSMHQNSHRLAALWYCSLYSRWKAPGPRGKVTELSQQTIPGNHTLALAYSSNPPMGANITPTMKNRGRTVFGVKMGLSPRGQSQNQSTNRFSVHTAMPSTAAAGRQYLHMYQCRCPLRVTVSTHRCLLGGLLLFDFFGSSARGSWLVIESVCSNCCVCDIVVFPRRSATALVGGKVRRSRRSWRDGYDAAERLGLAKTCSQISCGAYTSPLVSETLNLSTGLPR